MLLLSLPLNRYLRPTFVFFTCVTQEPQARELGERLAAYWNCELIEPHTTIEAAFEGEWLRP